MNFQTIQSDYISRLKTALDSIPQEPLEILSKALLRAWKEKRQVFIIGNGGSAGNAIHLANDFIYGISKKFGNALKVNALTSNTSVLTCLANDEGYTEIFVRQLAVLAEKGDILLAFSGSGNSPNIIKALEYCKEKDIQSFAVLGYSGGVAKGLADHPIHFAVNDMQISEDLQLIVGHILMQWLFEYDRRLGVEAL
jgi:D-sedoheptulose 7-phosphate isomerase